MLKIYDFLNRTAAQKVLSLAIITGVLTGSLSGCSSFHAAPLAIGSVGGAAAGAGTGALIGTVIANGDVAASALLGGAVGIPIGLALGALYDYNSEKSVSERKRVEINANQDEIFARQRQLDTLREQLRNDTPGYSPPDSERQYHYNGASFGNYYR